VLAVDDHPLQRPGAEHLAGRGRARAAEPFHLERPVRTNGRLSRATLAGLGEQRNSNLPRAWRGWRGSFEDDTASRRGAAADRQRDRLFSAAGDGDRCGAEKLVLRSWPSIHYTRRYACFE